MREGGVRRGGVMGGGMRRSVVCQRHRAAE